MKPLTLALLAFVSNTAQANQARGYATVGEALTASAHFNCSGEIASGGQLHLHVSQDGQKVVAAQLAAVIPGKTVFVVDLDKSYEPMSSSIEKVGNEVVLNSEYDNMDYFTARLELRLKDSRQGIVGSASFDDGDGLSMSSGKLKCSALNHILVP